MKFDISSVSFTRFNLPNLPMQSALHYRSRSTFKGNSQNNSVLVFTK